MDAAALREQATSLPSEPGVYQFLEGDTTLYVGKAVDLRSRVRSYADPRSFRIGQMVERAETVDYAVTDTETQALLLEANLIKRHQPKYNVRLKDDKSYPLVQLTGHEYPRIEVTRDPEQGATVFGPYTNRRRVDEVVKAIRETYGIRGCSDHKFAGRTRPCIDFNIGLCTAPCTGEIGKGAYVADVDAVVRFFEGESGILTEPLEAEMERAAANQEFERAANLRDRLDAARRFHGGGGDVVAKSGSEMVVDVLGVVIEGETATVARLHSERGQLVDRKQYTMDAPEGGEERVAAVLAAFIPQFYAERELPDAILLPERHDDPEIDRWLEAEGVSARVPGAGREATLVDLALKNARRSPATDEGRALGDALGMGRIRRIEGFDVSHAQGKAVVGSNVTFVDGSAAKADYRRKKLTDTNDDYANMRDLIRWRAERAVEGRDDRPDPDLLLIDGGEGQLNAAREALSEVGWDVPAIALAKAEELVITSEGTYDWPSKAPQLHLLQRVRDESHRFAVQYHQTLRDEVKTVLDDIPGVGPELRKRLLRRFGSVDGIRAASVSELQSVAGVGASRAEQIRRRLQ
ncbi:excinuclease ABC subunit C [Haladaptatus sp. GCM10025707]|uniref:excinuclease ABC subunit C n=1 Tax=unclassified Haladaptatus TaxID=2622732 RepID=UPI0023E8C006|nr:excinuclease ABC subunit C [Haladaptatus sp. QDMS2]